MTGRERAFLIVGFGGGFSASLLAAHAAGALSFQGFTVANVSVWALCLLAVVLVAATDREG